MARTIKFFSGVRFPDKINDILSDNQETYDELPYDELSRRGNRCYQNAKFSDALEYYEKAETKVHTDKDKEIDLYQKMADTYKKIGEYAKALSHYRKALDNCILLDSNESFKTAKLYQRIGDVLRKDSQYEKAKENFDKSIEILTKIQKEDPNDPDVASLYNDFGLMYLNEKKHEAAQLYYEDAYNIRENNFKKYGKEERQGYYAREYAYSVHNMGTYYYKKVEDRVFKTKDEKDSCLKKASEFHERAYNLRMDLLNGDDPIDAIKEKSSMASLCQDIAQSLTLWASDLLELGKDNEEKALEKCEKGLKIREAMQGTNIQDIAWSYYTMGLINYELKKNDAALKCFSESYRIRLKASNDKHPYAAKALYKMGLMKSILNSDKKDALQDLKKALGIQKDFLKKDDPELLDTVKLINELEKDQKEAAI
jgi:tetratricopeptide (TPR) repeat protein